MMFYNIKKFCFDGNEDSPPVAVTLTCGTGKVISLGEVLLGRNVYGLCTAIAGDCRDTTDVLDSAAENGEEDEEKKSSECHVLPCVGLQPVEDGTKTGHGNDNDPEASPEDQRSKRKRRFRRAPDKNQNMSARRLAPVGQEDEEEGTSSNAAAPASETQSKTSVNESASLSPTEASGANTTNAGDKVAVFLRTANL
nr:hypothetical protein BaRGS_025540 [Batillaria attramentaria]